MPYENIPGVGAVYLDGNLVTDTGSAQPRVLILGTAASGLTYELFRGQSSGEVRTEFGASSEMYKKYHEVRAQGADNIFLMRIGGKQGSVLITDNVGGTLTITPEYRDAEILDRYALILQPIDSATGVPGAPNDTLRILVYDQLESQYIYDSLEATINGIPIIDTGIVDITLSGLDLFALNDINDPDNADTLLDMVLGDFTADGAATAVSVALTKTAGDDGTSISLPERFAALEVAYHLLDYRDADIVLPVGVHLDDLNVVDGDTPVYSSGGVTAVPTAGSAGDVLGYAWECTYRGKKFVYMSAASTLFSAGNASLAITSTGTNTFTAVATGPAGEAVTIEFTAGGTAGSEVVSVVGSAISIQIDTGVSTDDQIETAFNLVAGATALASIASSSAGAMVVAAAAPLVLTAGSYLAHDDLTGDDVPAAVTARFQAGADAELREVNFAHSLASFLEWASTSWRTMIGVISTLPPDGFSRLDVASWVGEGPTLTDFSGVLGIDAAADEGIGLLGNKFLTGAVGYRFAELVNGSAGDGLAYGGFIKTVGDDLPNNSYSYGVDDGDEETDLNDEPVDIGKHIFVTYEYPIHVNSFGTYRGSFEAAFAGKLTGLAENLEPIGEQNGLMSAMVSPVRVPITLQNDLAGYRFIGLQQVDGVGPVIVNSKTAAHPSSDWTRISTIRSVNRELEGLRRICRGYIGKPFSSTQLLSLQTAIDGFLKAERQLGFNQGAVARLRYTRSDKIIGRLTVALTMIPPFSIERVTIETSLAADASELR